MAYTSIIPVRRLDNSINYVQNKEKTVKHTADSLEDAIDYALNREKTEQTIFEDSIGCTCNTAYVDMFSTKKRFRKIDGIQGYHLIQSFVEGEASPELVHMIGLELADRLLKGHFEVVITTHLNTKHYHNHLVFNSVSMVDGRKYHSNARSYYEEVRQISDELCRKYGLSVIEPGGKRGKSYAQWRAEQEGRPTWRTAIRMDIREAIQNSFTWKHFIVQMEKRGYEWKLNRKYIALKAPGMDRFVRLKSLGNHYSEMAIRNWILQPKKSGGGLQQVKTEDAEKLFKRSLEVKTSGGQRGKKKYRGLQGLYYHYLYQMGIFKQKPKYSSYLIQSDIRRLDKRIEQMEFLIQYGIETHKELSNFQKSLEDQVVQLIHERHRFYRTDRDSKRIGEITEELKPLRKKIRLCVQITQHSIEMEKMLKQAKDIERRIESRQEKSEKIEKSRFYEKEKR